MEIISSRSNPKVKEVRALRQRKSRQESGHFSVEGIRHVGEADEAGAEIVSIWYAPDLLESQYALQLVSKLAERGVASYAVTKEVFESLAEKDNPQGLLAIVRPRKQTLAALQPGNFPWGVALVDPQDPGNLGAILRTIDAVGASGLLLLESEPGQQSTVEPYHPSAVRASMGALFWHPVISASFKEFTNWAAQHSYHIYGTSAHADLDYREVQTYQQPCILLMGSEREGLTTDQAEYCESLIRLPMHGHCSSLNLAVATGVMLYAMLEAMGV